MLICRSNLTELASTVKGLTKKQKYVNITETILLPLGLEGRKVVVFVKRYARRFRMRLRMRLRMFRGLLTVLVAVLRQFFASRTLAEFEETTLLDADKVFHLHGTPSWPVKWRRFYRFPNGRGAIVSKVVFAFTTTFKINPIGLIPESCYFLELGEQLEVEESMPEVRARLKEIAGLPAFSDPEYFDRVPRSERIYPSRWLREHPPVC